MTESQHPAPRPRKPSALRPVGFIALIFGGVLAVVVVSKWWVPAEVVPWRDNFTAAQAEARSANKPMVVYFTARWCEPCQWMRRYVWTDRSVADALKGYVPVRVDIDKDPATAIRFHIDPIPAFFVVTPDGRIAATADHAMEAQEFINWLSHSS